MVIQRWQSVMLLIAGVMMGIFSFVSLGQIQAADYTFNVTALGIVREGVATAPGEATGVSTVYLFIVALLGCLLPLIGIFSFKNMKLQKNLCMFSILFAVVSGLLAVFTASGFASEYGQSVGWSSMICAPVIALIADIAAFRLISSDQKKLRAADRLR